MSVPRVASAKRFEQSDLASTRAHERARLISEFNEAMVPEELQPNTRNAILGLVDHALKEDETGQFEKLLSNALEHGVQFDFQLDGTRNGVYDHTDNVVRMNRFFTDASLESSVFGQSYAADGRLTNDFDLGIRFLSGLSQQLGYAFLDTHAPHNGYSPVRNDAFAVDIPAADIALSVFPEIGPSDHLERRKASELPYTGDMMRGGTNAVSLFQRHGFSSMLALADLPITDSTPAHGPHESATVDTDREFNEAADAMGWGLSQRIIEQLLSR